MRTKEVPIEKVKESRFQQRESYDEENLKELADSIKKHGLLQLPKVRSIDGEYEVAYGNRRVLAIKKFLDWDKIPVKVEDLSDKEMMIQNLIENIQREDLHPLEKGKAILKIYKATGLDEGEILKKLNKITWKKTKDKELSDELQKINDLSKEIGNIKWQKELMKPHINLTEEEIKKAREIKGHHKLGTIAGIDNKEIRVELLEKGQEIRRNKIKKIAKVSRRDIDKDLLKDIIDKSTELEPEEIEKVAKVSKRDKKVAVQALEGEIGVESAEPISKVEDRTVRTRVLRDVKEYDLSPDETREAIEMEKNIGKYQKEPKFEETINDIYKEWDKHQGKANENAKKFMKARFDDFRDSNRKQFALQLMKSVKVLKRLYIFAKTHGIKFRDFLKDEETMKDYLKSVSKVFKKSGAKPTCPICSKGFEEPDELKEHLANHKKRELIKLLYELDVIPNVR